MAHASPEPEPSCDRQIPLLDLRKYTTRHAITVAHATWFPQEFDSYVRQLIHDEHPDVFFLQVGLAQTITRPSGIDSCVAGLNRELGNPDDPLLLAGYYLFLGGQAIAFHAGIPDTSQLLEAFGHLAVGFVLTLLLRRWGYLDQAERTRDATLSGTGHRVSELFNPIIADWCANQGDTLSTDRRADYRAWQQTAHEKELQIALATLGASPDDSYAEVKRKRHELLRQFHPDTGHEWSAAHELTVTINRAWTFICSRKRWQP